MKTNTKYLLSVSTRHLCNNIFNKEDLKKIITALRLKLIFPS